LNAYAGLPARRFGCLADACAGAGYATNISLDGDIAWRTCDDAALAGRANAKCIIST